MFFLLFSFFIIGLAKSQTIQLLTNPALGYGYLDDPFIYNNVLYTPYKLPSLETVLAAFNGNSTSFIPNPIAGNAGFIDNRILFNGNLYFRYNNSNGVYQLAQFDGNVLTLIPNPDNSSSGYMGSPIVFNNKLYFKYLNNAGIAQLAQYDGTAITLIPNPDYLINTGYIGYPIVYNGNLYFEYLSRTTLYLAKFDGTTVSLIPNVSGGSYGAIGFSGPQLPIPIVFNNKLYFYYTINTTNYLAQYDGSGITVIRNPDSNFFGYMGYQNSPIIYNNKLYVEYKNTNLINQLAELDGTDLKLIPNPDAGGMYAYGAYPIIYHCNLYLFYVDENNNGRLAQFNGTSIKLITNPTYINNLPGINGYFPPATLFNNKLFFDYLPNGVGTNQLAEFNDEDSLIIPIANPGQAVSFTGSSIVYDNNLYIQFYNSTGKSMGVLTALSDSMGSPIVTISTAQDKICAGTTVSFTATNTTKGVTPNYQWKLNGKNVGTNDTFYVNSSLANGDLVSCLMTYSKACYVDSVISNIVKITVDSSSTPTLVITSSANNICGNLPVTFSATSTNGGTNPIYEWRLNGNTVGKDSITYTNNQPKNGDTIRCIMTSDAGCVLMPKAYSNDVIMIIRPKVNPTISVMANKNGICDGDAVTIDAVATNGGASPTYQWLINGQNIGTNSPMLTNAILKNGDIISCLFTSSEVCTIPIASNSITMAVFSQPTVKDGADTTIAIGTSLALNLSTTGNIISYLWTPSTSLDNAAIKTPIAKPTITITYVLTATSPNGCIARGKIKVNVFSGFYMATGFTPNNDGKNDIYRIPPSTRFAIKRFAVYNRWGKQLFSTTNNSEGWDGTNGGQLQPNGNYIWVIEYFNPIQQQFSIEKGTFLLVR